MNKKVVIIGSGFASLSAASYLAKYGCDVTIFEKNTTYGGRARQFSRDGFTFDMGPSWYWMPDIFERFFKDFGKKPADYYHLTRLDPAYKVFFKDQAVVISDSLDKISAEFERIERGSSVLLRRFMEKAKKNYDIAIGDIVYLPGQSPLELVTLDTVTRLDQFFRTISGEVRKLFKNPMLISILEFPALFLGAKPANTPAFYSFMNYADFGLGTWHPTGGMYKVVEAMLSLAHELGVKFKNNAAVSEIIVENGRAEGIRIGRDLIRADMVLSGTDYHHTEQLLQKGYRQYSEAYWARKTFAPSALLYYIGFDRKLKNIEHHNLFFDSDFDLHAREIYDRPEWPSDPLFYVNFPSVTDASMAPEGCETGFFLMPLAPGLTDSSQLREKYLKILLRRFEARTGNTIGNSILFRESFCLNDFTEQYNAYKGNAYGMANTISQTAFLRPGLKSKTVKNLYFTGQLTVPGPGVPPALISGKLAADLMIKTINIYAKDEIYF